MKWTGERVVTTLKNEVKYEHLHRYALSLSYCAGKTVLDIASGEGYGCALLVKVSSKVIGIDISAEAIDWSKKKYASHQIDFLIGSIEAIPLADHSIDVIVCFETIEHVQNADIALTELRRVLSPNGLLIISTPDKEIYSTKANYQNPFHIKEFTAAEFQRLLGKYFNETYFLKQNVTYSSAIVREGLSGDLIHFDGDFDRIDANRQFEGKYIVAFASSQSIEPPTNSLFNMDILLREQLQDLQQSITYKVGKFVLTPIVFLRNLIKK